MADKYQQLIEDFPLVFRLNAENRARGSLDPGRPFHCIEAFGIECCDGWYDLIRECVESIHKELLTWKEEDRVDFTVLQIKEKFGTLRFYVSTENEAIETTIQRAEMLSGKTCEVCGKPGKLAVLSFGWLATACPEHLPLGAVFDDKVLDEDDDEKKEP